MPTPSEVLATLQPLFRDILDMPDLMLTPNLAAADVDEWNSLNHIRMISATEQKFSLQITSAELDQLTCVGDLANLVAGKLST